VQSGDGESFNEALPVCDDDALLLLCWCAKA
jgi:hypothetical protein